MSEFPSIADLTDKNAKPKKVVKSAKIAKHNIDVHDAFAKKMGQVAQQGKEIETQQLAREAGLPYIDLSRFPVSQEALRQIPEAVAKQEQVVCFYATQDDVKLGTTNPTSEPVQELLFQVQERNHAHGSLYVISQKSFDHVLSLYKTLPTIKAVTKDVSINEEDLALAQADVQDFSSFQTVLQKASTTQLLTYVLGAAFSLDASDIHIEAEEHGIVVRFRLDGVLHDAATIPNEAYRQLVSRIKLTSSLKINVTDKPQDGRFTIKLQTGDVDVRVSTIPTVYGESIVMRLLKQNRENLTLDSLGMKGHAFDLLQQEVARPNGMIITTGPTGSGKTTTMYAAISTLNKPGVKIITLEDPVEYKIEGINQSQVDPEKGYTFASGLRSMLRQDPDIAMVGEIRDLETAETAIQAALTGHLMLSTIHTNNAVGAIPRFLSMGVKPFLLAPALNAVIGQRLVRKVCEQCATAQVLDDTVSTRVQQIMASLPDTESFVLSQATFVKGEGCEACSGIGYKGRIGIYEIFIVDKEVEMLITKGVTSEQELAAHAMKKGMITMVQDGVLKAAQGITSLDEVFRVIDEM